MASTKPKTWQYYAIRGIKLVPYVAVGITTLLLMYLIVRVYQHNGDSGSAPSSVLRRNEIVWTKKNATHAPNPKHTWNRQHRNVSQIAPTIPKPLPLSDQLFLPISETAERLLDEICANSTVGMTDLAYARPTLVRRCAMLEALRNTYPSKDDGSQGRDISKAFSCDYFTRPPRHLPIMFLHVSKSGGTSMCRLAAAADMRIHSKANNCWIQGMGPVWFSNFPHIPRTCSQYLEIFQTEHIDFLANEAFLDDDKSSTDSFQGKYYGVNSRRNPISEMKNLTEIYADETRERKENLKVGGQEDNLDNRKLKELDEERQRKREVMQQKLARFHELLAQQQQRKKEKADLKQTVQSNSTSNTSNQDKHVGQNKLNNDLWQNLDKVGGIDEQENQSGSKLKQDTYKMLHHESIIEEPNRNKSQEALEDQSSQHSRKLLTLTSVSTDRNNDSTSRSSNGQNGPISGLSQPVPLCPGMTYVLLTRDPPARVFSHMHQPGIVPKAEMASFHNLSIPQRLANRPSIFNNYMTRYLLGSHAYHLPYNHITSEHGLAAARILANIDVVLVLEQAAATENIIRSFLRWKKYDLDGYVGRQSQSGQSFERLTKQEQQAIIDANVQDRVLYELSILLLAIDWRAAMLCPHG
eukprot:gene6643-9430_t